MRLGAMSGADGSVALIKLYSQLKYNVYTTYVNPIFTKYSFQDIMQALRYAAWRAEEREVVLATA